MQYRTEIVRTYLAAFGRNDPDGVAACVTDDFVNEHLSELGAGCEGRDEYRRRLPGFIEMFDGLRYEVVEIIEGAGGTNDGSSSESADGSSSVAARYVMHGTYRSHPIEIPGVMWFEVRDGLIARRTDLWDSLTFLRQTGQAD